jgi:hypothetical protein
MKKDACGRIVMKENFFLRYFWLMNLINFIGSLLFKGNRPFEPSYPKNRCTRFWGFVLMPVIWAVALVCLFAYLMLMAFVITILSLLVLIIFPFGFAIVWPWHEEKYIHYQRNKPFIHPYRRYGLRNEKKFPAPWWFWLPVLLVWPFKGEYFHFFKGIVNLFIPFLFSTTALICLVVVIVAFFIFLLLRLYGKFIWIKIREIKKKTCLPIVVIKKEK